MNNDLKQIIEGILFVCGDEGISLTQLAEVLDMSEDSLQLMMDGYMTEFNLDETRGIEIVSYGYKYKFVTKAISHDYIQKLFQEEKNRGFSNAALETLAIIAYKQPITRVEIEEIRGVSCDMMIRKLLARGLIQEAGRLNTPGMPYTYEVTQQFLDTFSLADLKELPELPDYDKPSEESELYD